MERHINLNEISDGRLYNLNDMVRADCGDCRGCFACCTGMGRSIVLDPLDIFHLTANLQCGFQELLAGPLAQRGGRDHSAQSENERAGGALRLFEPGGALFDPSLPTRLLPDFPAGTAV